MSTRREGFTLIELMLVMVIGLMLLGTVYGTLIRQEQAYGMFNAVAAAQQDTRTGVELLTAEFRELSTSGADLIMATPDSVQFRALRKFGILCGTDKNNKQLKVTQLGADPFAAGDSILVYVDQDSLMAADDTWQREVVGSVGSTTCGTTLGLSLPDLLPGGTLRLLTLTGPGLRWDSIYPGAPIRSFEMLSYHTGTWNGQKMVMRTTKDGTAPLFGPIPDDGLVISYYDTLGTQLTTFPLSTPARASVGRMRIELRSVHRTGGPTHSYTDSLITDIYLRGS